MDKIAKHKQICDSLNDTYRAKNHDYGDSFGKTFKDLGIISAVTRISDKYNRIVSLSTKAERKVADESLKDTLLDMANYCIMTAMELEEEANELTSEESDVCESCSI